MWDSRQHNRSYNYSLSVSALYLQINLKGLKISRSGAVRNCSFVFHAINQGCLSAYVISTYQHMEHSFSFKASSPQRIVQPLHSYFSTIQLSHHTLQNQYLQELICPISSQHLGKRNPCLCRISDQYIVVC